MPNDYLPNFDMSAAIEKMRTQALAGDLAAVADLLELLALQKSQVYPGLQSRAEMILCEIYGSEGTLPVQRTMIEAAANRSSYLASSVARLRNIRLKNELLQKVRAGDRQALQAILTMAPTQDDRIVINITERARLGDLEALDDLVELIRARRFLDRAEVAETLADIFMSDSVSAAQKTLIWSLSDVDVYASETETEGWREWVAYGEDSGYIDHPPGHTTVYETFFEYLKSHRGLDEWLKTLS